MASVLLCAGLACVLSDRCRPRRGGSHRGAILSFAMVGRCDGGGLAAISREVHRALHPTRTLILDLEEHGRGECWPDDYTHGDVYRVPSKGAIPERAIEWLVTPGVDTLLSFETWYEPDLPLIAHRQGIRTVIYAMPELAAWRHPARQTFVPTSWRLDRLPNAIVLPMPIARDRLPFVLRKNVAHIYHVAGAAFHDRNGTNLLFDALPYVTSDVRVTIKADSTRTLPPLPVCKLDITVDDEHHVDYWKQYPTDADLLVLPRRYGGLSLVANECASLGIPALMLATDPYAQERWVSSVPSTGSRNQSMKGAPKDGIPVFSADPRTLANVIDYLARHPDVHQEASYEADRWAESMSWTSPLGDRWRQLLG